MMLIHNKVFDWFRHTNRPNVIVNIMCYVNKLAQYANTPMQYTAIFHDCKNVNFQIKNYNIFLFLL